MTTGKIYLKSAANPQDFSRYKHLLYGLAGFFTLLALYFLIVTLVSGLRFAQSQFSEFWYFILSLSAGFGIQIGLYYYLKKLTMGHNMQASKGTVAVTGTTSTLTMISCCAHYLANLIPILGIAGALSVVAQYQVQLFWIGLAFNLFGIVYISSRIIKFKNAYAV